uniref:Uncharacterized protein n=1 Tax=Knipowitschia caucasica TaxID=637954 RepID=A0AAV2M6V7_KNICA
MQVSLDNIRKRVRNNSYQDLRGEEPEGPSDKGSCPTFNAARRASEPGKVTMAAVAPFRFRWFQVQEERTSSAGMNLSVCSSDSRDVCCGRVSVEARLKRRRHKGGLLPEEREKRGKEDWRRGGEGGIDGGSSATAAAARGAHGRLLGSSLLHKVKAGLRFSLLMLLCLP